MTIKTFLPIVILSHLLGATVQANSCSAVGEGWVTKAGVQCAGHLAGETYTVTWKNAAGAVTGTATGTAISNAAVTIEAPAGVSAGDTFTVTAAGGGNCGTGTQIALLDPPATTAVATHTLTSGTAMGLGETFVLTGGFQVSADSLDQDTMSPTFGQISGSVRSNGFSMVGKSTSTDRTFQIQLQSDQPFSTNLAALLQSPWLSPANTFFETGFSGNLVISEGPTLPFEGVAFGSANYMVGPESPEAYAVQFQLFTKLGEFSGSFTTAGTVKVFDRFPDIKISFDTATETAILTYLSVNDVAFGVLGGDRPDRLLPLDPTALGDGSIQQYKHPLPGSPPSFFYRFTELGTQ